MFVPMCVWAIRMWEAYTKRGLFLLCDVTFLTQNFLEIKKNKGYGVGVNTLSEAPTWKIR